MNRLKTAKRVQILSAFVEGCSLRSTSRMADVSINTVTKLLVDLGFTCAKYQDEVMQNLPCKRIQCGRDLVILLPQAEERTSQEARAVRLRRRLDLGCHRR